jgi:hypothetical protein
VKDQTQHRTGVLAVLVLLALVAACAPKRPQAGPTVPVIECGRDTQLPRGNIVIAKVDIARTSDGLYLVRDLPCGEYRVQLESGWQSMADGNSVRRLSLRRGHLIAWGRAEAALIDCNLQSRIDTTANPFKSNDGVLRAIWYNPAGLSSWEGGCPRIDFSSCSNDWEWRPVPDPPSIAAARGASFSLSETQDVLFRLSIIPKKPSSTPLVATLRLLRPGDCP